MEASFKFHLPEEKPEYETYLRAPAYSAVICELDEWLRKQVKYQAGDVEEEAADTMRRKLWELLGEHDIGNIY